MGNTRHISYAAVCHQGLVRGKNQDNFWCDGVFLGCKNSGLDNILTGKAGIDSVPVFAVFDGLGGEIAGEEAAWLAAHTFNEKVRNRFAREADIFLAEVFTSMNDAVCNYAALNHIRHMGTTAAAVLFSDGAVWACNLGDSRIYMLREGGLTRLSEDHVSSVNFFIKPRITQFLGIPDEEFRISPSLARNEIHNGDKYLLCSDGLTDMLVETEIEAILSLAESPDKAVRVLLTRAIETGGKDNITIIVCTVDSETY